MPHAHAVTLNRNRGRRERRECWLVSDPDCLDYLRTGGEWPGLRSVVKVVGRREAETGAAVRSRYLISSLDVPAGQLLAAVRAHWSIEDSLHWSLDVTFPEGQRRVRQDHGPRNFATLRNISHEMLKRETSLQADLRGKHHQAARSEDYLKS